jgi:hypothetical protein
VFAGSLAARLGAEGWSSWGMFVVTGCLQGVLLGMGISFELRDYRKRKAEERRSSAEENSAEPDERTALLGE